MNKIFTFFSSNKITLKTSFTLLFTLVAMNIFAVNTPTVTKAPNVAEVCVNSLVGVTLGGLPGGSCTCIYEQQRMLPGASSWINMPVNSQISVGGTSGTMKIRARIACTGGSGCDTSAWVEVSWNVVAKQTAPTSITKNPNTAVCIGANVVATAAGSTGGTGNCYYLYAASYSTSSFDTITWTTNNSFYANAQGNYYARARRYCDGYGCDTSGQSSSVYWAVYNDPTAPPLVKSPNTTQICVGGTVTVTSSTGSGGQGTCADYYRYSDDGGVSWSAKLSSRPSVDAINVGQVIFIQSWRECTGGGCETSDTNTVSWQSISDPTWGVPSISHDSICVGGSVDLTGEFIGGVGGFIRWYRSTTPGVGGSQVTSPNSPSSTGTYYYYPTYVANPTNTGCNIDPGSSTKLVVIADPTWTGVSLTPTSICLGGQITFSANTNGGLGGVINWVRALTFSGAGTTVTSPDTPPSVSTYYYRPQYSAVPSTLGCNLADGTQYTVNVYDPPTSKDIVGVPVAGTTVCQGATISATFTGGTNPSGTANDYYEYSTNGGVSWNSYTPGNSITTVGTGTNIIQIRTRKMSANGQCFSDWNTAMWTVVAQPVAPTLNVKTPNLTTVCTGVNVNATVNAGAGGSGCTDLIEYSINNGGAWNTYTSGQNISTTGATTILIRASRGNCTAGSGCTSTGYVQLASWTVSTVTAATLTPNPSGGVVCSGNSVSATVLTAGTGGDGCTDVYQYRYFASGSWTTWFAYTPGSNISSVGRNTIEIRALRSCDAASGCAAENVYSWTVNNFTVTSPTMTKTPNLSSVCQGTTVSANIATSGSGGSGCSDSYQYRTSTGSWSAWQTYVPGTGISTAGLGGVEIRAWRGNCAPGGICGDSLINTYSWTVELQPTPPSIIRYPSADNICNNDTVRATITTSPGGIGCTNYSQYRMQTAGSWSVWYNYTSGQNILANGRQSIQVRAWKGNCTSGAGCSTSDTLVETWTVTPNITNPTISKNPNRTSVCEEENISAVINVAGSGGVGCSDVFEYRSNDGTSWSSWINYTIGSSIPASGATSIEIRAYRGNCSPGGNCNNPTPNVVSWSVVSSATPPTVTRIPNQDEVCTGTTVSATITAGSGGISCNDYRQYRYYNGTTWSSWFTYISGSGISTNSPRTKIQVRAFRGCSPTTGCLSTDTALVEWTIVQGVVNPTMTKVPNITTVCQGTDLSAIIATAGSGGSGCEDVYEVRVNSGAWQMYLPGDVITTDFLTTSVDVRATRTNCSGGIVCGSSTGNVYSWTVVPAPVAPQLTKVPNSEYVCSNQNVSVTYVAGSGYSCSDYFQYRRKNATTNIWSSWSFYPTGYQIPTSGYNEVELRAYNYNCNPLAGCDPDTSSVSWIVVPSVVAPTLTKNPNVTTVCQGAEVSATLIPGSGGDACSDFAEYSVDGGATWNLYTSGELINTIGLSSVRIRAFRADCNPLYNCPSSDTTSVSWTIAGSIVAPTVTRVPDVDVVCQGSTVRASIVVGSGGTSCNDVYQYRYYHSVTGWSTWITYPTGYNISTSPSRTQVEIRVFRSCTGQGCGNSDTNIVSWTIDPSIVNPTIAKNPNYTQVCEGTSVSATISVPGSGGSTCEDLLQFSTDGGASWNVYAPGDNISTTGLTSIIVRGYRGNCFGGGACTPTDTNQVTWSIVGAPSNPVITKVPNQAEVCYGTAISASINSGTGGVSCTNYSQYRIYSGSSWSVWYNYSTGQSIVYPSNATNIEVRAFRGNCSGGCPASDTIVKSWIINQILVNPILAKTPNSASVVNGTEVYAVISTPGSQGVGCSDILQYRTKTGAVYSAWSNYIEGNHIPTTGLTEVQVRGFRGNCSGGSSCPPADTTIYSWIVISGPQNPSITRNPNNDVCFGIPISATITSNGGGVSCSEYAQYRTYVGGVWNAWTAYTSGNNIPYPANTTQVEVRAWRGNCDPLSGVVVSDTITALWNITPSLTNPTLLKNPAVATVCQGTNVSATVISSGTGGIGCSDILQYRVHNGVTYSAWANYVEGTQIPTTGYTSVQIRGIHGSCISGQECPPADTLIYSWTVITGPIAPTIAKNPNQNSVCYGVPLSGTITPGSGGSSCSETYQSRTYNGTTWTAWTAYTSGSNVTYGVGTQQVQIRAFRGGCDPSSGCLSSDTNLVSWTLTPSLVNPILTKNPNISSVCGGVNVAASITTPGSGGVGCSDILQYRIHDGVGFSAWASYIAGNPIPTSGYTQVQIRGYRGACTSGDECPAQDTTIYSWMVTSGPIAPTIVRNPNTDDVCRGTVIKATITAGSGGDGCSDTYQFRTFNGSWSAWSSYTSGSNINYGANVTQVEVRGFRANCSVASGCTSSDTNSVSWFIIENLVNPILLKNPNLASLCEGVNVSATIQTPGSGGTGCSDNLQYRINSGSGYSAWAFYNPGDVINTSGSIGVQIRGYRTSCISGSQCPPADTLIYTWTVSPQPIAPVITKVPNQSDVCRGTAISASITAGSGGSGCSETYQYRTYNGTTWGSWSAYTSGNNIAYGANITQIEVRAFRGNCDPASGCTASDTTLVSWNIIEGLTNPILLKTPNVSSICAGVTVSASIQSVGTGGTGCSDLLQYRINYGAGYGAWSFYSANDPIPTAGVTGVQVRGFRGACFSGSSCPPADTTIYTWTVTASPIAPVITRNPNVNDVCEGISISATITPGSGGDACSETYQFRTYNGTTWTAWAAYVSASNIAYPANTTQVQVRGFRANCNPLSGCGSSDTTLVSWNIIKTLVNPVLLKNPNIASVCQGTNLSASVSTPGSGGTGCSDILQYRTNNGSGFSAWVNYVAGDILPSFGLTEVQVRGYRGGCSSGGECPAIDTVIYAWTINPQPTAPVIAKNPNIAEVCQGATISATITAGTGGVGCTDTYQYRTFNGSWSVWASYTSGSPISFGAATIIQVRGFRGGCGGSTGCQNSDTAQVEWTVVAPPVAPVMAKNPNIAGVCQGQGVNASVTTPGSGGSACSDVFEYRTNNGVVWSSWQTYTPSNTINTVGLTGVSIRSWRGNCASGSCASSDTTVYNWNVLPQPIAPVITKVPNIASVCQGTAVSATITTGSGGVGCTDTYEYRIHNGVTWSAWSSYTSGSNIVYPVGTTQIEVHSFRGNCTALSGCNTSSINTVSWTISEAPISPVIAKDPNVASVCQGVSVKATITTPGSGGSDCSDIYEYRTNNGSGFGAWQAYVPPTLISTSGLTQVEIRASRGNCTLSGCPNSTPQVVSWNVSANPIAPVLTRNPNNNDVCQGTLVSANITAGSGGITCNDVYEKRTNNGAVWSAWSAYVSGNTINTTGLTSVEIRGYRLCDPLLGCSGSDTNTVSWNVASNLVMPIMAKVPNVDTLCSGTSVQANLTTAGSGGTACADVFEYSLNGGAWANYTPGTAINTAGNTQIQVRFYRGGCPEAVLCGQAPTTYTWVISSAPTAPVITRNPNVDDVCEGTSVQATIVAGSGGSGCTNYAQYRTNNGLVWSAWANYSSASMINTVGLSSVQVRAWRGNCISGGICAASDTSLVSWNISTQPIAPVLSKIPNIVGVCDGTTVKADLVSAGSGGASCSDRIQYRTNNGVVYSAWQNYTIGSNINTVGITEVQIISTRDNCNPSSSCPALAVDTIKWTVVPQPTAPVITKNPNAASVCYGTLVRATVTPGIGGIGCQNKSQYRTFDGTSWTNWFNYASNAIIPYPANTTQIQVRAWRSDCTAGTGCLSSDTALVSWNIVQIPINAVISKTPNLSSVCASTNVQATLTTAGSGGLSCSDIFEYRTNNGSGYGAFQNYTIGTNISTTGLTAVQIISYRGNCDPSLSCSTIIPDTLTWLVTSGPSIPTITKVPNDADVCSPTTISANITLGSGGSGCTDYNQYRFFDGTSWSAWTSYTSGATIPYLANTTTVQVRAWRGNCTGGGSCTTSDTTLVSWNIQPQLVAPVISKNPNINILCQGASVSATLTTAGSGGVGCSDIIEYRTNNGTTWTAWSAYTLANNINTTGLSQVQIRSWRGNCASATCVASDTTVLNWDVTAQPTAPQLTRNPNQNIVCDGTLVSATITAGSGGTGCNDILQYRTNGGSWNVYTSGNTINTTGLTSVDVRAYRSCPPATGCVSVDTTVVSWQVSSTITMPVMAKIPNTDTICSALSVSATLTTPGSGGTGCSDIFEYSIDGGTTWLAYTPGNSISTVGLTTVKIHFFRGGCPEAVLCGTAPSEFTWNIAPTPIAPTITKTPNLAGLCAGTPVSGIITPGTGGMSCTDNYQSRTFDGTTWSAWVNYTSGSPIITGGLQNVEIRAFRENCNPASGCVVADTALVSWNITPQPIAPIMAKVPNVNDLCEGDPLTANLTTPGSGGAGCSDVFEYRTNNGSGYSAWQVYTPSNPISSVGLTQVQIISYRGNCDAGSLCSQTSTDTITWNIVPQPSEPVITRIPNQDNICWGSLVRANVTPGIGGIGCVNKTQYRLFDGTSYTNWFNYASGAIIPYVANTTKIELRAWRGDCTGLGCITSDTITTFWNIWQMAVNPVLAKVPDVTDACQGINVKASLTTPGSGGAACSDIFEYRTNNGSGYGAWAPYVIGTDISSAGLTSIQIIGYRGNCDPLASCPVPNADTLTWTINPQPIAPQIVKNPNVSDVCNGTPISATLIPGSGGVSCSDVSEYRLFNGITWSSWTNYVSSSSVIYGANIQNVEIRAFRGNCNPLSSCISTDTTVVSWNISAGLIAPVLSKMPSVNTVCEGMPLSASLTSPGSGGAGCEDLILYRTNSGLGYGAWLNYVPGSSIPSIGLTNVQIISYRGNCTPGSLCTETPADTLQWAIVPQPINPTILRNPDLNTVCYGTLVRANVTAGIGGVNCTNYSQFRLFDGTSWTAWLPYISNAIVPYPANTTQIQVRAWRGNCEPGAGCNTTDTAIVQWNIAPSPIAPIIGKNPNLDGVCSGNVSANIIQPGSGGSGCSDVFEYRTDSGSGYGAWLPYTPSNNIAVTGLQSIQIRAFRGNCDPSGCNNTLDTIVTWNVSSAPIAPIIVKNPNQVAVCQGITVSGVITAGSGGSSGCADVYESRTYNGTTWSAWANYTTATPINTIGITNVEIRVYRLCNPLGGCSSTDTTTISWSVSTDITMPSMAKVPDILGVCSGTTVSATLLTPGSGGSATCEDVIQSRTYAAGVWSAWQNYTPSSPIATIGKDSVQIQYYRGNCPEAAACGPNAVNTFTWFVSPQPIMPALVRIPDINTVCQPSSVSATITPGSGGAGCSDTYEYRTNNGVSWSAWMPYISNNPISTNGLQQIEIQAYRSNCSAGSGCLATATATVSWNVAPAIIPPVLSRVPNTDMMCQGNNVSATLTSAGSGGAGCSDVFEYRTNNGGGYNAFAPYIPGTIMSSVGITSIQVISYRGNCSAGSQCVSSIPDTLTWNFVPEPIEPIIVRIPNQDTVCSSTPIIANITAGTGGLGCSDTYQYRYFDGTSWSVWTGYISGSVIPFIANTTNVEVRAFRANCDPSSLCNISDTILSKWVFYPENIAPVLAKNPNLNTLCMGTAVSATLTSAGSGGAGCSDVFEYRTNNGSGYGAWTSYVPGNNINTTGIVSVQIISYRGNCNPLANCTTLAPDTLTWIFTPQPTDPTIAKTPNVNDVCNGTIVSAQITPGINGVGCSDISEYRLFDGAVWSAWTPYSSMSSIPYNALTQTIEIRAYRGDCDPSSLCTSSNTITTQWNIVPNPIAPTIVKVPDVNSLCSGSVSANVVTLGSGGSGCSDVFEYRIDNGTGYAAWLTYVPSTPISVSGLLHVQIRALRGNCAPFGCANTSDTVLTWDVSPGPIAPIIVKNPNQIAVCQGITVSGIITPGSGGSSSCADVYESRTYNGATWTAWSNYTSTTPINTIGITNVEIRVYRLCDPSGGCSSTDTTTISWSVSTDITMPVMAKVPDVNGVCEGYSVSANLVTSGSGGSATCEDVFQYRTNNAGVWTAWQNYIPTANISTSGADSVQIQYFRGNCPEATACGPNAVNTFTWEVLPQLTAPIVNRIPDQDAVCEGALLTAVASGSTGGVGPIDYEYQNLNPGSFVWNAGNSFTPNSYGMAYIRARAVTSVVGCDNSDWEWVSWVVERRPEVNVTGNATICQGANATLNAFADNGFGVANVQWQYSTDGCSGPWTNYDTLLTVATPFTTPSLNQTTYFQAIVFQAGSSCQTVSSCITVNVNPAPIASITGVTAVCETSTAVLVANVVNPPASITFQWQQANAATGPWFITGTNNDSLSIVSATQPKWYRLIVLNNGLGCNDTSDVVLVQNGTSPVISAISGDVAVCENGNTILSVSATSFPSPSYQWYGPNGLIIGSTYDTLMLNGLQLADEGNYYVAITNPCGTINSSNIFVDMINNMTHPTSIIGTAVRCQGDGTDLYVTDGSGILATNWTIDPVEAGVINSMNGFVTWDTAYSGIATISVQAFGCNDTAAIITYNVTVNPTVQAPVISGSNVRCVGPGTDTYTAVANGGTSYVWNISNAGWSTIDNNGMVTWDPTFTGTAVIFAYAQGCNGPSGYSNFLVYSYDTIYYNHSGNVNVCQNSDASLWISPIPPVGNTYQWYDNQGEIIGANDTLLVIPNVQLGDTNTYYCRIISYCGDTLYTAVDSLIIRPTPLAAYSATGICKLDTIFFTNSSTVESGSLGYIWNFGDGNQSTDENPNHIYLVADTFSVSLVAISEWGCSNTITKLITIKDLPTAQIVSVGDSCNGSGHGSLTIVPQTGDYPFTYTVNNGTPQSDSLFGNLSAGIYTIQIVDGSGCQNTFYGEVTQPQVLITNVYPQHNLCYSDTSAVAILEVIGGTEPYFVVWSNGDTAQNLLNVPSGYYTVGVIDANGCTAADSVTLYQPNPMYVDSLVIPPTCLERNDGKIFVYVSGGTGGYDYLWSNTSVQDSITNLPSGTYFVTVTDAHGCTQIKGYKLETPPNNCLTIWTSYSPDGDGINDVWNIGGIDLYPECTVEIFNRWGYKIYESKGYDTPWDGKWNGKELPSETYYFAINLGDGSKPITGTVTIIR